MQLKVHRAIFRREIFFNSFRLIEKFWLWKLKRLCRKWRVATSI